MKRILLPTLLLCATFATAQISVRPTAPTQSYKGLPPVDRSESPVISETQVQPSANRGSTFFYEDFSNGLGGSTPYGAWTVSDIADNSLWHIAGANSPDGPVFGTQPGLNSESENNGWMIFDPDFFIGENTTWEDNNEYMMAFLTSPEINMSQLSSVLVDYQQFFVYGYRPISPLTLEVSIDDQQSWFKFGAHGDYDETYAGLSANPEMTVVDISCIAAYQSSVYLRFAYNSAEEAGYQQYFWALDDIRIYENEVNNDIRLAKITNGNVFTNFEYRATPMEQRILAADGGLVAGAIFANTGLLNQPNVTFLAEILDENDAVIFTAESDPLEILSTVNSDDCPGSRFDTLYFSTGFEPTAAGDYVLRVTLLGDSADATPANNTMTRTIFFTDDEYGHDDPAESNINLLCLAAANTSPQEYQQAGWGNYYLFPYSGSTAYGVAARFSLGSDDGVEFKVALIQQIPGSSLMDSDELCSGYYQMAPNWQNGTYKYFPFENTTEMTTTNTYFACVWREEQGTGQLHLRAVNEPDDDLSSRIILPTGNDYDWFAFFPYTPSVRLVLSDRVGVDELPDNAGLLSFNLFPNPAVNETRVDFNLEGSRSVAYEIRDVTGKLMGWSNVGDMPQGENSFTVDVSSLPAGNYLLNLVIDGGTLFSRQLNIQR